MELKIKMTKEILERSKYCPVSMASENCAIALAIRDIFPDAAVGNYGVILFFDPMISTELPVKAREFIAEFDESNPEERVQMTPVEFNLELPEEIVDRIDISEITKLLENHPHLELV